MALLDVHGLGIAFPRARPVQDLSFTVGPGETVALVGESGSGKSLTALALMRLLPPRGRIESGTIRFDGRDIGSLSERRFREIRGREIAMVFQEPMTALNPVLTVGVQIAEVLRRHEGLSARAARARAVDLLDRVRIPDPHRRVDAYPHQLSGGMRQRVMIAVAVACAPKLLIADEPTTALDVTIQAQVLDLIDSLRRDLGMAVLLITHDLGVVGQWADRVVVMYAGRRVEEAEPDALFDDPLHPYTRGLLAASPRGRAALHGEVRRGEALPEIPGSIASAQGQPGCAFAPRCPLAEARCRAAPPPAVARPDGRIVACPVTTAIARPALPPRIPGHRHDAALGL
ncbi:ABC transporter ATP-binding protein [Methylobacterium indicum]|uniref:Peptide ABC transporter ATP-binding protein n=1 Tax=Methylobacterium indicum TaxID=1775910 RepID=A0ABR5HFD9_9HYPH|nr:ABC transporter ATP-binding protein [Methylobacterium indicum]KMO18147.1 peptide ABC transporter ATP-binding protein [Methylobacterium indicum]KMO25291.1 peptide ABC transporter ATP-binding protein [Methylobacterium indicum]